MITAQEWLNEKFPTKESRAKVKSLCLRSGPESGENTIYTQPQDRRFGNLNLTGELDLSDFTGLDHLGILQLNNLTAIKA